MRRKITLLLTLLLGFCLHSSAQEYTVYNQYHFHYYLMNPALAGAAECTHFMLTHKQQWIGLDEAPYTTILSFQTRTQSRLGIGAYLYNDRNGYSYQQGGEFTLAYHIPMSRGYRYSRANNLERQLSFGVSGKFYHYQLSQEVIDIANTTGEYIQVKDGFYPNANFGVFYQSYHFFTGLSVTNLIPVKIDMYGEDEPIRPFTAMYQVGYGIDAGRNLQLEPSAVFKIDQDSRNQLDLGFRAIQHLDDRDISWWAGAILKQSFDDGYQPLVLLPNFTIRIGKFRLGYAVNIDLNKLVSHNYSSHEIMLGYSLCSTKKFCR
jgi:type IX secretion system PorP/SprF family membrane protein